MGCRKNKKQKNARSEKVLSDNGVYTLIDNNKLANQIARLPAIVVKRKIDEQQRNKYILKIKGGLS